MEVLEGGLSHNNQDKDAGRIYGAGCANDDDYQRNQEILKTIGEESTFGAYADTSDMPWDQDSYYGAEPENILFYDDDEEDKLPSQTEQKSQSESKQQSASESETSPASEPESKSSVSEFGNLFGGFVSGGKAQEKSEKIRQQTLERQAAQEAAEAQRAARMGQGDSAQDFDHAPAYPAGRHVVSNPADRRWAWMEVDLGAIHHNLMEIRKRLSPGTAVMAVVKANGYGHGAVEVAGAALRSGASRLAVATVDEGVALRAAGITAPIQILAEPPISSIPEILEYDLIPAVYTYDFALALGEGADSRGKIARFHLAVNSGMNRIGLSIDEVVEFIQALSFHRGLEMEGIFTHFATADSPDTLGLKIQLNRFEELLQELRYQNIDPGIVHAAASAAAIRFKQTHFDMVRIGIAMYGLHPSSTTRNLIDLHPAMSIYARVTQVNDVTVGEGVSYGFTYQSPGSVTIATLPVGYADGMSRILSNHMMVSLKGVPVPQVGNICMDQMMIEVDRRKAHRQGGLSVAIGDEVTIIGNDHGVVLSLDEMAEALGTINYELACRFGMRFPRLYIPE